MVNEFRVIGKSSTVKTDCGFRMFLNYLLIAVRMFPDSCKPVTFLEQSIEYFWKGGMNWELLSKTVETDRSPYPYCSCPKLLVSPRKLSFHRKTSSLGLSYTEFSRFDWSNLYKIKRILENLDLVTVVRHYQLVCYTLHSLNRSSGQPFSPKSDDDSLPCFLLWAKVKGYRR